MPEHVLEHIGTAFQWNVMIIAEVGSMGFDIGTILRRLCDLWRKLRCIGRPTGRTDFRQSLVFGDLNPDRRNPQERGVHANNSACGR